MFMTFDLSEIVNKDDEVPTVRGLMCVYVCVLSGWRALLLSWPGERERGLSCSSLNL